MSILEIHSFAILSRVILTFSLLVSLGSWAMPETFEVWFLQTPPTEVTLIHTHYKSVAQSKLQCQKMGDYCFDPQVGLYKLGEEKQIQIQNDYQKMDLKEKYDQLPFASSLDRKMVDCTRKDLFDIYCGHAEGEEETLGGAKVGMMEIWVDTSSTMRQVDFSLTRPTCERERFLESVLQSCKRDKRVKLYSFDTYKREMDVVARVCHNEGLNDMKRIMKDIKASRSKKILIITDIFEAEADFINFIESTPGGSHRGLDQPLYARDIHKHIERLVKECH